MGAARCALIEHPRFRAAYDLLLLRAELGLASTRNGRLVDQDPGSLAEEREQMAGRASAGRASQGAQGPRAARADVVGAAVAPQRPPKSGANRVDVWQPAYIGVGSNQGDPPRADS